MKTLSLPALTPEVSPRNLVIFSALMVLIIYLVQGDTGLNLQDEGFLWYGTIRAAMGEVPIRDFQSYDPGRYYWGALWFKLLRNDGIMALRISQAVFQFIGLTVALLLVRRVTKKWLPLIGTSLLLLVWMFPPWKIYEPVITIIAVYFAVLLLDSPTKLRHFLSGVFIGLAAFFGRNHGIYCLGAFVLIILFVWWKLDRRELIGRLAALGLGVVLGYSPMLIMLAVIPGFFRAFLDAVLFNVHVATNLPLPVPWPWRVNYSGPSPKVWINGLATGLLYLAFPVFYILGLTALVLKTKIRANRLFTACIFVGAVYLHYIFERPHLYYLAWTIPPLILGLIALPYSFSGQYRKKIAVIVWSGLIIISFTAAEMAPQNYFLIKVRGAVREKVLRRFQVDIGFDMPEEHHTLVKTDVRGDHLWVTTDIADAVNAMNAINQEIPGNDGILVAPYWTAFYPILNKKSPTWEIYFLFPQTKSQQEVIVADLEQQHVNWALTCDFYLDNRPELKFESTHSYVWEYLATNFETMKTDKMSRLPLCQLLHRTAANAVPVGAGPVTGTPPPAK
jgi:hypothetical protein